VFSFSTFECVIFKRTNQQAETNAHHSALRRGKSPLVPNLIGVSWPPPADCL